MTPEEQREKVIQSIANQLRYTPFTYEFKVLKHPKGIKIIYEVTEEEMNEIVKRNAEKERDGKKAAAKKAEK